MDTSEDGHSTPTDANDRSTSEVSGTVSMDQSGDDTGADDQASTRPKQELALEEKEAGNVLYKQGKYYEALAHYTKAIDFDPSMPTYCHNRAAAFMQIGKYAEALDDARRALKLDPTQAKYHNRVAKCYAGLGRFSDARRHYASASEIDPGNKTSAKELLEIDAIEQYMKDAETAASNNHFNNATSLMDRALAFAPRCVMLQLKKAKYRMLGGDVGTASRITADVLRAEPLHADALCLRGRCFFKLGNTDQAIAHFRRALTSSPDHAESREHFKATKKLIREKERGNEEFKAGNYEEAIKIYEQALSLSESDIFSAKIHFNLAISKSKLGMIENAVTDCQRAVELDPAYEKAKLKVPQLYLDAEMYEDAVRGYEELCQEDPHNREYRAKLREAKLELKKSKRKNYYKILGVEKNATEREIKKAYRKAALTCHPDRVPPEEKESAEAKFKELGEAYSVLSDSEMKMRYDNGEDLQDMQQGGGMNVNVNDIFAQMFGNGGGFRFHGGQF